MSHFFRVTTMNVAVAAGLVLMSTGGALAGVTAASGTKAPPPPVDHQLCYTAAAKGFHIPPQVVLKNQFSPQGFMPKIGTVAFHCNPVEKTLPTHVFPITNPAAHLLCFKITAPRQPTPVVMVTNQFGQAVLNTGQPNLLCLPSWKKVTGPPRKKPVQPPGLSHFTCYPVKVVQGGYRIPKGVMLRDQFSPRRVPVQIGNIPVELCLPTEKHVGRHVTKIVNPLPHLLCFPVSRTPIKPRVFDQNQFGTAAVHLRQTTWLCLPSLKQVVHG